MLWLIWLQSAFFERTEESFSFLLYINEKWSEAVCDLEIHLLKGILPILW